MALLSKEEILAADDIQVEDVEVPEWGGTVRVRGLTGAQRSLIQGTVMAVRGQSVTVKADALAAMQERLVAMSLVDGDGKRLFTDKEVGKLAAKNAGVIARLFTKAQELSGLAEDSVDAAAGNSDAAQSDGSTTG